MKVFTNSQGKVYMANSKALSNYTGKYNLLDRIKDDSGNEIGTVSGFFTDANDNEYAVVCLDAKDRFGSGQWCSDNTTYVTNLPLYTNQLTSFWYHATETATFNTQKILDFCTANNYTSSACTKCRSISYVIGGTTYYGQLPNMREIFDISTHFAEIEAKDPTASDYSSTNFSSTHNFWSSNQYSEASSFYMPVSGGVYSYNKAQNRVICPVLEIPN